MMSVYTVFIYFLKYVHATKKREAKFYLTLYAIECMFAFAITWFYIIKIFLLERRLS